MGTHPSGSWGCPQLCSGGPPRLSLLWDPVVVQEGPQMEGNWGGGGYCSASHPQLLLLLLILLIFNFFSLSVIAAHLGSLERSRYQRASQEGAWGAGAGVSPARERSGAGPAPVLPPSPSPSAWGLQPRFPWHQGCSLPSSLCFKMGLDRCLFPSNYYYYFFCFCQCDCLRRGNIEQKPQRQSLRY